MKKEFKPKKTFLLRKSVALVGAAILLSAPAQAQLGIGRLPSTNSGDGQVLGAKPNVFIIIDNGKSMTGSKNRFEFDQDGNYLQQTAGALIAALPQLEGKVRLGYTTIFKGTYALSGFKYGGRQLHCRDFKLNGNVDRLDQFIPGLKADLAKNPNYVTGAEDFVFNDSGSGYGNTVPRDFRDNYARYIYAWLGAMCMGNTSDRDNIPYNNPWNAPLVPPYADLRDKDAYQAAAIAANNKNSYPVVNFIGVNVPKKTHKPLIDMYARVLGQVSDERFICSLQKNNTGGSKCIYTDLSAERGGRGNTTLRNYPEHPQWKYLTYDAYAPTRSDNGFPDDKNPLSCRKNYTIMISHGAYGQPSDYLRFNSKVGTDGWGIDGQGRADGWRMPNGREFPRSGYLGDITRMYRFLPIEGNSEVREIPKASYQENGKTYFLQGAAGKFLLSKMILQSYYQDLRSNLPDDVTPYIAGPTRRHGPGNKGIPPFWDRKNDTAPWQHMTFFALGFTDDKDSSFPSWRYANRAYKPYYNDVDESKDGILEPYFRAIEDGTIYESNKPLADWGRGGYGLKSLPMSYYFYKNPQTQAQEQFKIGPNHFQGSKNLEAWGEALDMDYAKAGMIGRGGAYEITDYTSIKKVIQSIADTIESAMAQGITGGAVSGGNRVTASQQAAGGNDSVLFTTYIDEETLSGNIFAFKNCPLIQEKVKDSSGALITNPEWAKQKCGQRLWNAATALYASVDTFGDKTIVPVQDNGKLVGRTFSWTNLDADLQTALKGNDSEEMGKARVEWINGKLQKDFTDQKIRENLRVRSMVFIPDEQQNYKKDAQGNLVKDSEGNLVLAEPTTIPNLIGEIVYATPKAVDNRGTLPAAHPLNDEIYNDFVNNTVKLRKPLVFAGSNDGHLYAFASSNNEENASFAFSFIPRGVITKNQQNLADFTNPNATTQSLRTGLVNGPFAVRDAFVGGKWATYLVGSLGQGGDSIYALDISTGRPSDNMFKWEVSGYGNIMADPRIVWIRKPCGSSSCQVDGKWVVLVPTGYNAKEVALVILDLETGAELAKIDTHAKYTEGSTSGNTITCNLADPAAAPKLEKVAHMVASVKCENGLGPLTVFDENSDSGSDIVFSGDLFGHVWKFDLSGFYDPSGTQAADLNDALKVAYEGSPLFIAETPEKSGSTSTRQPITSMIEIDDGAYGEGSMLYFGTGRLFSQEERSLDQQQSFYGIWDIPRYSTQASVKSKFTLPLRRNLGTSAPYGFLRYEAFVIPNNAVKDPNSSLSAFKELRGMRRIDNLQSSKFLSYNLQGVATSTEAKAVGWIIDFPASSSLERVIDRGRSYEDIIFFPSFTPEASDAQESCGPQKAGVGGAARFYMLDRLTGGQLEVSPFDFNGDGKQDADDGVQVNENDLANPNQVGNLNYPTVDNAGNVNVGVGGILVGSGTGGFLSLTGVLERSAQATQKNQCDYSRQVIFPSTADPVTGNPLVLSSCNQNRYRVWKQPVIE